MDELRGFSVLCMVFYHAFFSMAFLFSIDSGLKLLLFFMPLEPFFAGLFILISGISSQLSRSNIKRGLKLLIISVIITIVTILIFPDTSIIFGILHMLSICMIMFGILKPLFEVIKTSIGLILCAFLFIFTMNIESGYLGFFNMLNIPLPNYLYRLSYLFPIGITNPEFFSSDYFPLFPWMFLFLFGTFLGRYARYGVFPNFMYKSRFKFLSFWGTHSLFIYIVHQPIIYVIFWIIDKVLNIV